MMSFCTNLLCSFVLLLASGLASRADDTNSAPPVAPAASPVVLANAGTNTSSAFPGLPATNVAGLPTKDASPAVLNPVDTGSPGLTNAEANATAQKAPSSTARFNLQSFRVVWERNIFNPNRRPARFGGSREFERDRRPPTQSFALVGTISYEKGRFAFFEGSSFEYRRVLKPADSIAGYKVADIAPNHVKLEGTNGQAIELAVGMEMRKREEEAWQLGERSTSSESASATTAAAPAAGDAADSSEKTESSLVSEKAETSSSSADEVLKRLLQKREQELNK